jgi:hypothetical protein
MEQNNSAIFENIGLDELSKAYLMETTRWTKFLAIMGFLTSALIFLFAILYLYANGNFKTSYNMGFSIGSFSYFAIIAGSYIYPAYCLYKFSSLIKRGILADDKNKVTDGLRYQKNLYRYLGILTIIAIVLIIILFIIAGSEGIFG